MGADPQEIVKQLPYLRRYSRALTGSQERGDGYIRVCLETLLEQPDLLPSSGDVRFELFKLFHRIWGMVPGTAGEDRPKPAIPARATVETRLGALPAQERQVVLLTSLEGYSIYDAARILDVSEGEAKQLLSQAWSEINRQVATTVLVIEDEPVIGLDIANIVREMGHTVVGIAASEGEAIQMARQKRPGLVLADIQLKWGGSGIDAVDAILGSIDVPVIFVTAYPERLLTGERREPTYLVTKPFEPAALKVAISQALSFRTPAEAKARLA